MTTSMRALVLAGSLLLALLVVAGPAGATEAADATAPGTEAPAEEEPTGELAPVEESGSSRVSLPQRPHDRVGLLVLAFIGVGAAAAFYNARKQLKGERPKATGEFRWR